MTNRAGKTHPSRRPSLLVRESVLFFLPLRAFSSKLKSKLVIPGGGTAVFAARL